tara:strand:- start:1782 stop:2798 length:1017 start_codon:yes stop_codon:yes gene_type:complete
MHVNTIDSLDDFNQLETDWNTVYSKDPESQFFLSWTWFPRIFLDHPDQCRILAVRQDLPGSEYIGFFPIRIKTKWSKSKKLFCNEIQMAGTLHWGQYHGFICEPLYETDIIKAFADKLKEMHWERLTLKYFYASITRTQIFLSQFSNDLFRLSKEERKMDGGTIDKLICPYIELPNEYESYLQTLSSNTRQKIRRFNRKLEHSEDLYITTTSREKLDRDLDILVDLWTDKWASTRGSDTDEVVQKYRRVVAHGFENNTLYMPIFWRNDTPLGVLACFVDWQKPNMYFFVAGRNVESKDVFIGWLLHSHNIKWAINNGFKSYDFLHGNETYKYSYGCKE